MLRPIRGYGMPHRKRRRRSNQQSLALFIHGFTQGEYRKWAEEFMRGGVHPRRNRDYNPEGGKDGSTRRLN